MIAWRTSRFLLMFFILQLALVGIVVGTLVQRGGVSLDSLVALVRSQTGPSVSVAPVVPDGVGHPVELPQYPVVEIRTPAISVFDPAA